MAEYEEWKGKGRVLVERKNGKIISWRTETYIKKEFGNKKNAEIQFERTETFESPIIRNKLKNVDTVSTPSEFIEKLDSSFQGLVSGYVKSGKQKIPISASSTSYTPPLTPQKKERALEEARGNFYLRCTQAIFMSYDKSDLDKMLKSDLAVIERQDIFYYKPKNKRGIEREQEKAIGMY